MKRAIINPTDSRKRHCMNTQEYQTQNNNAIASNELPEFTEDDWTIIDNLRPTKKLLSGGSIGADSIFAEHATKAGHTVRHLSFDGHNIKHKENVIRYSVLQLSEANVHLSRAASIINRVVSRNPYVNRLLQRNYMQVRETDAIYAISSFEKYTPDHTMSGIRGALPLYLFEQKEEVWYQLHVSADIEDVSVEWKKVHGTPVLSATLYTGVGTRGINKAGKKAIQDLFNNIK